MANISVNLSGEQSSPQLRKILSALPSKKQPAALKMQAHFCFPNMPLGFKSHKIFPITAQINNACVSPLSRHLCKKDTSLESSGHEYRIWSRKTHLSQGSGRMYLPPPSVFCFRLCNHPCSTGLMEDMTDDMEIYTWDLLLKIFPSKDQT